ncbi:MAG: BACON domain-containing protein [Desulfobulbaceae bacterium]
MKPALRENRILRLSLWLIAICLLMLHAGSLFASGMPAYTRLSPVSAKLKAPTSVTLDGSGRVYVAETDRNLVRIYSRSGSLLHTISGLGGPVSLAVDAGGRIYIGNRDRGDVEVFDPSLAYLFSLGLGLGEFGLPNDIDIAASGLIYVVDKTDSVIKLYNPDGTYNSTIGRPGNDNGQFHYPVSLAIDAATNELVVLDLEETEDSTGMIDGARIQFLKMNGDFRYGSSKFGYDRDNGDLVMPMQVAVDGQSRVYVTDARLQKVMVYDHNGIFLGMIDDETQPFLTPLGLAMDASNKLYVASLRAGRVEVYGIDSYIDMSVSPAVLNFEELQGAPSGAGQNIIVNNTGNSTFTWTARSAEPWLSLPVMQGSLPAATLTEVAVEVNIDGLDPGQYQGNVTISAGATAAETITVTLSVLPNARLSVSPDSLSFASTVGTTPAAQTLSIENAAGGTLSWNANVDLNWMVLSETSGTAPSSLKVYADVTMLAAGSYSGTVTVSKQGESPEMQVIPVVLTLTEPSVPPVVPPPVTGPGDKSRQIKWTSTEIFQGMSLQGIWGESATRLFAVGSEGAILRYNGKGWARMESGVTESLFGIWGSSAVDIYAVGEHGVVLHYDGSGWSPLPVIVPETLRAVWGSSAVDVYAVSRDGSILESFSTATPSGVALRGIWGGSRSDVFAVGEGGAILHFDGSHWEIMNSDTTRWLNGIWGSSSSDVFAVGENGAIVHFDGSSWTRMDSRTTANLHAVWGRSGSDVFAAGENGLILYYNGHDWYSIPTTATDSLNGIWVSARSEVFAVGENGTLVFGKDKFPRLRTLESSP